MAKHPTSQRAAPLPCVRELPLLGSLSAYNRDRLGFCTRVYRECGDVGGFHFGPLRVAAVSAAEEVQRVLFEASSAFTISRVVRTAFGPLAANGLLTSGGEFHRRQRKVMAPAFQPRHITSYADTMVQYGERIQRDWRDGEVLPVGQAMTRLTMSIIGKVLFGAEVFTEADELGAAMKTALEHVNAVLSTPFSLPFSWPLPGHLRTRRALVVLKGRIQQMIDGRRAGSAGSDDLLSMLLRARDEETGEGMSDQQICDEAITLFFAGHETIATALTWTWYLLAAHPDVQVLVQDEVDRVLQGRSPSAADLERLPYCLQVFKEALRLDPPIHAIVRVARHDLEVGGYQLRRGDTVLISPYVIQHRSDYFPNPERFDPERFTAANERRLPRYAFIPFGAGPRICIGNHFATMEGHLLLATLAQRVAFELIPGEPVEPEPKVTLRPKHAVKVVVRRRRHGGV